ncbi:hypothetical protein F4775DRAFT_575513 [Biscogniauxia sp. FL1348]|nr:hypothetical protein F4775DRAFT_575513 [Biscogniauxia sp. FL1348]
MCSNEFDTSLFLFFLSLPLLTRRRAKMRACMELDRWIDTWSPLSGLDYLSILLKYDVGNVGREGRQVGLGAPFQL